MAFNNSISRIAINLSHIITTTSSVIVDETNEQTVPFENRRSIMATFISLYTLIFFFGISGNALVICT